MKHVSQWYRQVMGLSPRKKKILLICLWCMAPIEMGIITGVFYLGRRLHQTASLSSTLQDGPAKASYFIVKKTE